MISFDDFNKSDDGLLSKIIGYLNAVIETSQNNTLSMSVILPQIYQLINDHSYSSNTQPLDPLENTFNNTNTKHAQIQMNMQAYMRDWESREIQEDDKKLWSLYNAGVRVLSVCAMAGVVTTFVYSAKIGIGMLLVGPLLGWIAFISFKLLLDGIDFKLKQGVSMVDTNHSADSETFFNKKKEALNGYILNSTSENPSENIVNKVESRIVRASVLTYYRSNVYTSYNAYREGRQLLSNISVPSEPMVDVRTLTKEIQGLRRSRN